MDGTKSSKREILVGVPRSKQKLKIYDVNDDAVSDTNIPDEMIADDRTQCIALDDHMYFLGGNLSNALSSFNISSKTWKHLTPARRGGWARALCIIDRHIYSTGGLLDGSLSAATDRYNTAEDKWESLPDNQIEAWARSACCLYNKVFVSGGEKPGDFFQDGSVYSRIDMFNPKTKVWSRVGDMLAPRYCHFTCGFQDKIYIVGDARRIEPFIEIFDLRNGQNTVLVKSYLTGNTGSFTNRAATMSPYEFCFHDKNTNDIFVLRLTTNQIRKKSSKGLEDNDIHTVCAITI